MKAYTSLEVAKMLEKIAPSFKNDKYTEPFLYQDLKALYTKLLHEAHQLILESSETVVPNHSGEKLDYLENGKDPYHKPEFPSQTACNYCQSKQGCCSLAAHGTCHNYIDDLPF